MNMLSQRIEKVKRKIICDLSMALADLPAGHQVILSQAADLITLSDYSDGENKQTFVLWIKRSGKDFDPIQFANDAEIMLSMIKSKMEVAA